MGFMGFTILFWPIMLPIMIISYLIEDPSKAFEIIAALPGFFASLFYGFSGIIFEFIPQRLAELLPSILEHFSFML